MNQVRINAGIWRSRVISFPDSEGLRPTPERVRQTVFNWLGQDMTGKTCLDLFSGTGAMGFEALSRNASSLTALEIAPAPYGALLHNARLLGAKQAVILQADAMRFLEQSKNAFDVIFCDPPYHQNWLPRLMPLLHAHLKPDGWLYVEAEYAIQECDDWNLIKQGKAGHVYYHLLKSRINEDET